MKLYFMIGLPTETDEDVAGIVEDRRRACRRSGGAYQRGAQVTASVSTHVPKPHTPFQWAAMDDEAEIARKQELLAARARALRVSLKMHENQQSHIEGIFARGDRRVADILEAAFRLGCRFDGWDEGMRIELWDRAIAETAARTGVDVSRYLGTMPVTARLPWDHIDIGLEPDFLLKEYRKALKDRLSPPCGKPYKKLLHPSSVAAAEDAAAAKLICYDCGIACDLGAMKEERLFYLRRMNACTASRRRPPRAPTPTAPSPTERRPVIAARRRRPGARRRGRRTVTACATRNWGGSRSWATWIWCATCRASSGGPGSRSTTRRAFTRSRSCRTARRWASASRRWASWSTSRWSTTSRPTSCCAGWRASRWTASSSPRRRAWDRRIARSAA
jgi:hypothetical protein